MDEQARYQAAQERVEELRGFYIHLASYLIVNLGILAIDLLTNSDNLWFYWPAIGWGVGLAIHAFVVFSSGTFLGKSWEERKIRELMERDRGSGRA